VPTDGRLNGLAIGDVLLIKLLGRDDIPTAECQA
jgi:hypothetical protein